MQDIAHRSMSIQVSSPEYEGYVVIDTLVEDRSAGGVQRLAVT